MLFQGTKDEKGISFRFWNLSSAFVQLFSVTQLFVIYLYFFYWTRSLWRIANHLQKSSQNKFEIFCFSSPCITQQTSTAPKLRLINLDGFINVLGGFRLIYSFPQKSHSFCLLASLNIQIHQRASDLSCDC